MSKNLRDLMAEEDKRVQSEVKQTIEGLPLEEMQERLDIVLDQSKQRQRRLFDLYWQQGHPSPPPPAQ